MFIRLVQQLLKDSWAVFFAGLAFQVLTDFNPKVILLTAVAGVVVRTMIVATVFGRLQAKACVRFTSLRSIASRLVWQTANDQQGLSSNIENDSGEDGRKHEIDS